MKSRSKKRKPRSYHHGDLPTALRQAAADLVADEGFAGLSMRKVAQRAGVSHAAPGYHYPTLEALLADVAKESFEVLARAATQAVAGMSDARERLRAYGLAYIEFARQHPGAFRIMFQPLGGDDASMQAAREAGKASLMALVDIVAALPAGSAGRALDPRHLALLAWSVVHGFASLWLQGPLTEPGVQEQLGLDPEQMAAKVVETFSGLVARHP